MLVLTALLSLLPLVVMYLTAETEAQTRRMSVGVWHFRDP